MRRWYPDERDEEQYTNWTQLSVTEKAIYAGEPTEKDDGFCLFHGEVEGDGDWYQQKKGVEIWFE